MQRHVDELRLLNEQLKMENNILSQNNKQKLPKPTEIEVELVFLVNNHQAGNIVVVRRLGLTVPFPFTIFDLISHIPFEPIFDDIGHIGKVVLKKIVVKSVLSVLEIFVY